MADLNEWLLKSDEVYKLRKRYHEYCPKKIKVGNQPDETEYILKVQLIHAEPIIRAQERQEFADKIIKHLNDEGLFGNFGLCLQTEKWDWFIAWLKSGGDSQSKDNT